MADNKNPKMLGRRRTLQLLGVGVAAATGLALVGCDKKESSSSSSSGGGGACTGEIDETSKGLRKALQYKEAAADPAKQCKDCLQYDKGKFGECGGCKLFTGPVKPGGSCMSFAAGEAGSTPT